MSEIPTPPIKKKTPKPSSISNANKAREAKKIKFLERQAKPPAESDDDSEEEIVYIPTKKKSVPKKKELLAPPPVQPIDYQKELEILRKEMNEMRLKPEPPKPVNQNQQIMDHMKTKLLNF